MRFVIASLTMFCLLVGCQDEETSVNIEWQSKRLEIAAALDRLDSRDPSSAFVNFSDRASGNFIQFAGGGDTLHLDLPESTLHGNAMERAKQYFHGPGVSLETRLMLSGPGGEVVGELRTFSMDLTGQPEAAAKISIDVFREVYQLESSFELVVNEN